MIHGLTLNRKTRNNYDANKITQVCQLISWVTLIFSWVATCSIQLNSGCKNSLLFPCNYFPYSGSVCSVNICLIMKQYSVTINNSICNKSLSLNVQHRAFTTWPNLQHYYVLRKSLTQSNTFFPFFLMSYWA